MLRYATPHLSGSSRQIVSGLAGFGLLAILAALFINGSGLVKPLRASMVTKPSFVKHHTATGATAWGEAASAAEVEMTGVRAKLA